MNKIATQVIDSYDDPFFEKKATAFPEYVRGAGRLSSDELAELHDRDFAVVVIDRNGTHRKWPIIDRAHVYLAAYYWNLYREAVPEIVRAVAAHYILESAKAWGIEQSIPGRMELAQSVRDLTSPPVTNVINLSARGSRYNEFTRPQRNVSRKSYQVTGSSDGAPLSKAASVSGIEDAYRRAFGPHYDKAKSMAESMSDDEIKVLSKIKKDRGFVTEVGGTEMKNKGAIAGAGLGAVLAGTAKSLGHRLAFSKSPKAMAVGAVLSKATPFGGAAVGGGVTYSALTDSGRDISKKVNAENVVISQEVRKRGLDKQSMALPSRGMFPIGSETLLKRAMEYFMVHEKDIDPSLRFEMAENIIKQAEETGVEVHGSIWKYASCGYRPDTAELIRMRNRFSSNSSFPKEASETYESLAKIAEERRVRPDVCMRALQVLDKHAGVDVRYGKAIQDPGRCFAAGDQRLSKEAGYVTRLDDGLVTERHLDALIEKEAEVKRVYGQKTVDMLKMASSRYDYFKSLPAGHQRALVEMSGIGLEKQAMNTAAKAGLAILGLAGAGAAGHEVGKSRYSTVASHKTDEGTVVGSKPTINKLLSKAKSDPSGNMKRWNKAWNKNKLVYVGKGEAETASSGVEGHGDGLTKQSGAGKVLVPLAGGMAAGLGTLGGILLVSGPRGRKRMKEEIHDPRLYSNLRGMATLESRDERVAAHKKLRKGQRGSILQAMKEGFSRSGAEKTADDETEGDRGSLNKQAAKKGRFGIPSVAEEHLSATGKHLMASHLGWKPGKPVDELDLMELQMAVDPEGKDTGLTESFRKKVFKPQNLNKVGGTPFLEQDRPAKVKEIYQALVRDHPDWPAEVKARIAARKGKSDPTARKSPAQGGPEYKAPLHHKRVGTGDSARYVGKTKSQRAKDEMYKEASGVLMIEGPGATIVKAPGPNASFEDKMSYLMAMQLSKKGMNKEAIFFGLGRTVAPEAGRAARGLKGGLTPLVKKKVTQIPLRTSNRPASQDEFLVKMHEAMKRNAPQARM